MAASNNNDQTPRLQNTVRIPLSVLSDMDAAQSNIEAARLTSPDEKFLNALLELAQEHADAAPDRDVIAYLDFTLYDLETALESKLARGTSRKSVREKCYRLEKSGFFETRKVSRKLEDGRLARGRDATLFILNAIHEDDFQSKEMQTIRELSEGRKAKRKRSSRKLAHDLKNSTQQVTFFHSSQKNLTENLFTGVCDRVQRFTTQETVENNRITGSLRVKGVDVYVQSTTSTSEKAQLAALSDQRVTRALITEITHKIDYEIDIYKKFAIERDEKEKSRYQNDMFGDAEDVDFEDLDPPLSARRQRHTPNLSQEDYERIATASEELDAKLEKEGAERVRNDFIIDVTNLCRRCNYSDPTSGTARRFINQSLRRQYDTNYRIRLKAGKADKLIEVMKMFGLPDHTTDLRLITSLKSQFSAAFEDENLYDSGEEKTDVPMTLDDIEEDIDPYNAEELQRVRWWRISIDPLLFDQLLDRETRKLFNAHKQIMSESSGLAQTLYNVFSAMIGRTNRAALGKEERTYNRPVTALHNLVWPTREYYAFKDELISIMKRYCKDREWDSRLISNEVRMWGFIFRLYDHDVQKRDPEKDSPVSLYLYVARDPDDPETGNNSPYNRALAAKAKQADWRASEDERIYPELEFNE